MSSGCSFDGFDVEREFGVEMPHYDGFVGGNLCTKLSSRVWPLFEAFIFHDSPVSVRIGLYYFSIKIDIMQIFILFQTSFVGVQGWFDEV
jgi:hypothetical protein